MRVTKSQFNTFIKHIKKLSYNERRKVIYQNIQPSIPRFIYKYRSIDPENETSINRLRDIFVRSFFWLSSPRDFNDPFEMSGSITLTGTAFDKRKRIAQLARIHKVPKNIMRHYVSEMMEMSNEKLLDKLHQVHEETVNRAGVYSFAGDPRNILMWSHYAQNHTGICLQFERSRDFELLSQAIKVDYSTEYPEMDWINDYYDSVSRAILRKHEDWKYEKESRIIHPNEAHTTIRFNPSCLTRIIIGCRAPEKNIKIVKDLLKERKEERKPPIKLYKAVQHKSKYTLTIHRY